MARLNPPTTQYPNMTRSDVPARPAQVTGPVPANAVGQVPIAAPIIDKQPVGGDTPIKLTIRAHSHTIQSYQWEERVTDAGLGVPGAWGDVAGGEAKTPTLNVESVEEDMDYRCTVTNSAGSVTSSIVTVSEP